MSAYRDETESLRARIATLEAENAALRPAPVGPTRWKLDLFGRLRGWQIPLWLCVVGVTPCFTGQWHWPAVAIGSLVMMMTFWRRVPR